MIIVFLIIVLWEACVMIDLMSLFMIDVSVIIGSLFILLLYHHEIFYS